MLHSHGVMTKSPSHHLQTGAWAESTAISWLLHRNWIVCKNVSGHGFVDLIATKSQGGMKQPKVILIDVKYYNKDHRSYTPLSDQQKRAGVCILLVEGDGNCRFIEKELDDEKIAKPDT